MELIHGKHKLSLGPRTAQMYHFFIWGEPQAASAKAAQIVLPDTVPLHSDNCHVIRLHLR